MNETAEIIVKNIVKDLSDRRGLRHEWDNIDDDVKAEIIERWESIAEQAILEGE